MNLSYRILPGVNSGDLERVRWEIIVYVRFNMGQANRRHPAVNIEWFQQVSRAINWDNARAHRVSRMDNVTKVMLMMDVLRHVFSPGNHWTYSAIRQTGLYGMFAESSLCRIFNDTFRLYIDARQILIIRGVQIL